MSPTLPLDVAVLRGRSNVSDGHADGRTVWMRLCLRTVRPSAVPDGISTIVKWRRGARNYYARHCQEDLPYSLRSSSRELPPSPSLLRRCWYSRCFLLTFPLCVDCNSNSLDISAITLLANYYPAVLYFCIITYFTQLLVIAHTTPLQCIDLEAYRGFRRNNSAIILRRS